MEMSIAKMATEQKSVDLNSAVGIAVLKMAQETASAEALALVESLPQAPQAPQAPSAGGLGGAIDVSI